MISRRPMLLLMAIFWSSQQFVAAQLNSFGLGQFGNQHLSTGPFGGSTGPYGDFEEGAFSQFQRVSANGPQFSLNSLMGYGIPPGVNFGSQARAEGFDSQGNYAPGGFGAGQSFSTAAQSNFPQEFSNQNGQFGQDVVGQQGHQISQAELNHVQLGATGQFSQDQAALQPQVDRLQQGGHGPQTGFSRIHNHGPEPVQDSAQVSVGQRGRGDGYNQGAAVLGQPGQPVLRPSKQRNVPLPGHISGTRHLSEQHDQQAQQLPHHQQHPQEQHGGSGHNTHGVQHLASQSRDHQGGHPSEGVGTHGIHNRGHEQANGETLQGKALLQNHHQQTDGTRQYNKVNYNDVSQYTQQYDGQQLGLQVPPQYQQQVLAGVQHKDGGKGGHGTAAASTHPTLQGIPLEAFAQYQDEQLGKRTFQKHDSEQRSAPHDDQLSYLVGQQEAHQQR